MFQMATGMMVPAYGGTTGIIAGTVTDAATGEKLAGVNVIVEGTNLTTVTDENGYYVITNVPPGEYKVTAELVGYSDFQVEKVSVVMDMTATVDMSMDMAVAEEEEVVVTQARPMIQRDMVPTMYLVDSKQERMITNQPNTLYQTPGIVATQPGVIVDESGYPHIRGGRANQVGYMLDGVMITEPITNGFGTNTVTVGLDKMEMYTGGYRPEYGNAISGVFNQVVKTGRTAPGFSLEMLAGSDAFKGAYPQLGGVMSNGADYYVGGYLWHTECQDMGYNEVDSSDLVGKFNYPVNDRDKLTLLLASGSALYQYPTTHTSTFEGNDLVTIDPERDHSHQGYWLSALTWTRQLDSSKFFSVRPYYFRSKRTVDAVKLDYSEVQSGIPYYWQTDDASMFGLQFDYTDQISPKHLLKAGAMYVASDNFYRASAPLYRSFYGVDYDYVAGTDTVQTGLYVQDQITLSPKWRAEVGLRYDRMKYDKVVNPDTAESQISPRLGLSYAIDSKSHLRFSYGKMIQFVYTQAMERVYTDPAWAGYYENSSPRPERCAQFDIGYERQVSDDYSVQITPFYRKYQDLLQTTLADPTNPDVSPVIFDNLGDGISRGVEVLIKKRPSRNWSGWLAYTWSKAKANSCSDREFVTPGTTYFVDWDQRHTAVAVLNYMNKGWTYSLVGEYGSGLPYYIDDGDDSTTEIPNSLRVSPHTVFSLSISREITGGWLPKGEVRLNIVNLFNTHKVLDRDTTGEPTTRVSPRTISFSYMRRY